MVIGCENQRHSRNITDGCNDLDARIQQALVRMPGTFFIDDREIYLKPRTLVFLALAKNIAVMVFYEAVYHCQVKAGPAAGFLGDVKRLENMIERVTANARSSI
jgi:hypothetical protein